MEMQHPSISPLARWAQNVSVALAGLILPGIFTQGFLIGTMLFGSSSLCVLSGYNPPSYMKMRTEGVINCRVASSSKA